MIDSIRLYSLIDRVADLTARISATGGGVASSDLRKNLRAMLVSALARMDLVTREEFDVQTVVLARTRARLEELEKQVRTLEELLSAQNDGQKQQAGGGQ